MWFLTEIIVGVLVASVILLITVKTKKKFSYFLDRGLPFITPTWMEVASSFNLAKFNEIPLEIYERCRGDDAPYIGFFHSNFLNPTILIQDPKLVESVLIKDFSHFEDHIFEIDFESIPLARHLFSLKGDEWRTLRHKLVPAFTSGKLKGMVPIMEECADKLIDDIKLDSKLRENTNLKELFKRYSLTVIGSCVFGIDPVGLKDPNCEFRQILNIALNPSLFAAIKGILLITFPSLMKRINVKFLPQRVEDFFFRITREAFELRKKSGVKRNDFVQLLLELKEKGSVELHIKDLEKDEMQSISQLQSQSPPSKLEFTDELLVAQAFSFLVGGFDNTAYITAITTYMLSKHLEIKSRVVEEVTQIRKKYGGINYQGLREMKLLGACIDETLRLYPSLPILIRECNKAYTFIDGKSIEKGVAVVIPSQSLHYDSKYWTDPQLFNPDRFLTAENIQPGTYLPFGDGPRICIAQRLSLLMTKLILAKLVLNFDLLPSPKTKEPLKVKPVISGADNEGGLWGSFKDLNE